MCVQDGLDEVLQTHTLAYQLSAARDLSSKGKGRLVRDPHFREKAGRVEFGQHSRVYRVSLYLCMRDEPNLLRIGNDDAVDVRCEHLDNGCRIAGCLDDRMVVMRELLPGKVLQALAQHGDATEPHRLAIEQRHAPRPLPGGCPYR